ncbi:MAG: hypothetical protein Q9217_000560 [Psora testacea]
MAGSVNLLDFVSQRQQGKEIGKRAATAQQYKVAVPPTRLQKQASGFPSQPLGHKAKSNQAFAKPDVRSASHLLNHPANVHGDTFDTDVEGVDDTTVISNTSTIGAHVHSLLPGDAVEHTRWNNQGHALAPINAERQASAARDEDSYEGSDEEGSYEDASDGNGVGESVAEGTLQSPGFAHFRQRSNARQAISQSMRTPAFSNATSKLASGGASEPYSDADSPSNATPIRGFGSRESVNIRHDLLNKKCTTNPPEHSNHSAPLQQHTLAQEMLQRPGPDIQQGQDQLLPAFDLGTSSQQPSPRRYQRHEFKYTSQQVIQQSGATHINGQSSHFNDEYQDSVQSRGEDTRDASRTPPHEPQTQKRGKRLDYTIEHLAQMSYQQLQAEPFDHDPTEPDQQLPADLINGSLSDRLTHLFSHRKLDEQGEQRDAFFSRLTIDQYEECGELIIDKVSSIISKFKDARWQKRKVAKEFEEEIGRREERVRRKDRALEEDLERMKKNGIDLVKGGGRQRAEAEEVVTGQARNLT